MSALTRFPDELLARIASLDLSSTQRAFEADLRAGSGYHELEATGLEYRRLLLIRIAHPDLEIRAAGSVADYQRLHARTSGFADDCRLLVSGTGLSPDVLADLDGARTPSAAVRELYDHHFPCGDVDLWGWPSAERSLRRSAPRLPVFATSLPTAADPVTIAQLRAEASALRSRAREGHASSFELERGAVSGGEDAFSFATPGPALWGKHWSGSDARLVSEAAGQWVVPTGVFYNFHPSGAGSPLHTDPYGAELALLTWLDGPIEPLHCHLDLVDTPLEQLLTLAESTVGQPAGGAPHDIGPDPFLFTGQAIPHHRRPAHRDADVVVAAQFFGVLAP